MTDDAGTEARISPRYMLLLIVTIPLFAWLYFLVGTRFFDSPLSLEEYVVFTTLIAIIVTGCYQLFFWVQHNNYYFKKRCTPKDHLVLPVSHKGMLISRDVVDQTAAFLQRGEFLREA